MNNLLFAIFLISLPVAAYFIIRAILAFIKKNRSQGVKQIKFTAITAVVLLVSLIAFVATSEPIDEKAEEAEGTPLVKKSDEEVDPVIEEPETMARETVAEKSTETPTAVPVKESSPVSDNRTALQVKAENNAESNPAKPGAKLFGEEFKGMDYYFGGTLVKTEKVEGLFGEMMDALLVKNDQGYVMPIFPPYEVNIAIGDEIEVWGPLSGDGYSSSDLGVDNVVGATGAINASLIYANGIPQ